MADINLTYGFNNNTSCLCQSVATYIILPTLYSLMFLTGVPGNILSLWVFMTMIPDKTPTHIHLINLGMSNLVLCLTMPFQAAYYSMGTVWDTSHPVCKIAVSFLTPMLHTNIAVGMTSLTWVALSRCAILVQHTNARRPSRITYILPSIFLRQLCRTRFAWVLCLGTWGLMLAFIVPAMVTYSMAVSQAEVRESCYSARVEVGRSEFAMAVVILGLVIFFLCYLLVLSSYMAVTRHIFRIRSGTAISDRQRIYARVLRNIVVIQAVLTVCLLPHHIYRAIFIDMVHKYPMSAPPPAGCHPLSVHVEVKNMLLSLAVLRCSVDPITYFLLDRTFHKHTVSLLGLTTPSKSSQPSVDSGGVALRVYKVQTENSMMTQCAELGKDNLTVE